MGIVSKSWKFFEFEKIFIIKKGFYNKKPESSGLGTIPFIGASDKNHGITEYYTYDEIDASSKTGIGNNSPIKDKLFKPHAVCVTNNGSVGYAYYMDEKFTCSHDVNPLYKKDGEFNYYTGMFISTVIMNDRYRWGYGRKWRPKRMNKSKIKLPIVMENGAPILDQTEKYSDQGFIPDWEFMETYIKKLNYKKPKTSNSLNEIKDLNVSEWEKFRLSDLFNTQMGNGIDAGSVSNDEPRYNYVSRNRNNNGVVNFVDKIDGKKPFEAGNLSLALGGSYLGSCFVQNKRFYTGQNVGILTPKLEMSLCTKQFIATIIRYECRYKYQAFGRELNAHFKKDFYLKLPILKDKHNNTVIDNNKRFSSRGFIPDWEFMETYIKSLPNGDLI